MRTRRWAGVGPENLCHCTRPLDSGRVYLTYHACVYCSKLIVDPHARRVVTEETQRRNEEHRRASLNRALGGLDPHAP